MKYVALAFDFDDTLAPDSSSFFLKKQGVDPSEFWPSVVGKRIADGWDPVTAYLYEIKKLGEKRGKPFTKQDFVEAGKELTFHPGIPEFFNDIKEDLKSRVPDAILEFYLISSGIGDVIRSSGITSYFTDFWSCEWHYDENGHIEFPRKVVSFTDKTRYIYQISKGLVGESYRNKPFEVNKLIENLRIPMDKIVYIGDGLTDVAVFSLLKKYNATCYAVFDPEHGSARAWSFIEEGRVRGLFSPKFNRKSDLYLNILMALENAASR
jgi:hypothetical protein